jgi:TPR repeat protein
MRWLLVVFLGLVPVAYSAAPVAEMSEAQRIKHCRRGHAEACTELGRSEQRKGNLPKAAELFRQGCSEGDAAGCCNLGVAYWGGRGVTKDFDQAGSLLTQACETGLTPCCTNLGLMHKTQALDGLEGDEILALFDKGCEGGHMQACFEVGHMNDEGELVARDLPRAMAAYEKACSTNVAAACANMGRLYRRGEAGIEYDVAKAQHYYQLACDGGHGKSACMEAEGFQRVMECRQICSNLDEMFKAHQDEITKQGGEDTSSDKLKLLIRVQPHCLQGCLRDGTIKVDCALKADTVEAFMPCSNY